MSTAKAACTRKSSRVAIVGGGLAGMVAADALASRGFEDLHVFDMGETFVFWFLSLSKKNPYSLHSANAPRRRSRMTHQDGGQRVAERLCAERRRVTSSTTDCSF